MGRIYGQKIPANFVSCLFEWLVLQGSDCGTESNIVGTQDVRKWAGTLENR